MLDANSHVANTWCSGVRHQPEAGMRKAEVELLVGYMYWVNHRLLDAAERLDREQFAAASHVTTRDLRATLVHELTSNGAGDSTSRADPTVSSDPMSSSAPPTTRTSGPFASIGGATKSICVPGSSR